jgi:hypothetical protein
VAQSEGINAAVPLAVLSLPFSSQCGFGEEKVPAQVKKMGDFLRSGAGNFFSHPFCRINAAFHLATERRIYAAAKNCVVHPLRSFAM